MSKGEPLFKPHQRVVHVATGTVFRIVDPPTRLRMTNGKRGYSYTRANAIDITLWVECQKAMEDGRFVAEGAAA